MAWCSLSDNRSLEQMLLSRSFRVLLRHFDLAWIRTRVYSLILDILVLTTAPKVLSHSILSVLLVVVILVYLLVFKVINILNIVSSRTQKNQHQRKQGTPCSMDMDRVFVLDLRMSNGSLLVLLPNSHAFLNKVDPVSHHQL